MTYDDLMAVLHKRRRIRRFKADSGPEELVVNIIDAARWAPSGFNLQPWATCRR